MSEAILATVIVQLVKNAPAIIRLIATALPYANLSDKEGEELTDAVKELVKASRRRARSVVEQEREHEERLRSALTREPDHD